MLVPALLCAAHSYSQHRSVMLLTLIAKMMWFAGEGQSAGCGPSLTSAEDGRGGSGGEDVDASTSLYLCLPPPWLLPELFRNMFPASGGLPKLLPKPWAGGGGGGGG